MGPGEMTRFACYECGIVFDLTIAPLSDWVEELDENDFEGGMDVMPPTVCPFCQSADIRPRADTPIISE